MFLTRPKLDDIKHRLSIGEEVTPEEQQLMLTQVDYEKKNFPFFYTTLTPKQCQIYEYFKNYNEVIVPGGNRCGKTHIDCMMVISRLSASRSTSGISEQRLFDRHSGSIGTV